MLARRLSGVAAVLGFLTFLASARADEPVLLKYRLTKGDQLIYKSVQEQKQVQTIAGNKIETTMKQDAIMLRTVGDIDSKGTATLKTMAERRKVKDGSGFVFDSKSSERDTSSEIGAAATPLLERLTGSEYEVMVNPRGQVVDVKGFVELLGDLIKDNPVAAQIVGGGGGKAGVVVNEQDAFVVLSDKAVSPGDQWEVAFDVDLTDVGKVKGKIVYVYEANDKVGDRQTVRIGVTPDVTVELKLDAGGAKVTGALSTNGGKGTVQFDPRAGRMISMKRTISMSGQLTVEAGGQTFPVDSQTDETVTLELLEKLPE